MGVQSVLLFELFSSNPDLWVSNMDKSMDVRFELGCPIRTLCAPPRRFLTVPLRAVPRHQHEVQLTFGCESAL